MITLLQKGSFRFNARANIPGDFKNVKNEVAIDCIIKILDKKYSTPGDLNSHYYFLDGRTGSGKSTALPVAIFKHFPEPFKLQVVEPRVILATSIPEDICGFDTRMVLGKNIGYTTGAYKQNATEFKNIMYMTTDVFRKRLYKNQVGNIVVVDEVHMLDRPMINTLKAIKEYMADATVPVDRKPLFIFQSATINLDVMIEYFFDKPDEIYKNYSMIGHVEGQRNYPVDDVFIDAGGESLLVKEGMTAFVDVLMNTIVPISIDSKATNEGDPCRDILIFCHGLGFMTTFFMEFSKRKHELPTMMLHPNESNYQPILDWRKANLGKVRILVLTYVGSRTTMATELLKTNMDPDPESRKFEIKIYISTNVLETGKTINTLYQVLDTGLKNSALVNPLLYNPGRRNMLTLCPIDQSAAIQRAGRVGRRCEGISRHVYTRKCYETMDVNPQPENVNVISMADIVLDNIKTPCVDLPLDNDYLCPNSFDTMLRSSQDLIYSGYSTPFGALVDDVHNYKFSVPNWVLFAKSLYYIKHMDLFEACFTSRLNRNNIPKLLAPNDFDIGYNVDDIINCTQSSDKRNIIESIIDARGYYNEFLYNPSKSVFKHID